MFSTIQRLHFVGIGGIGMSGIAEILLDQGFHVSGSDISRSEVTDRLSSMGAVIHEGHEADNIGDAEVVVYSSAVVPTVNPECVEARRRGIPLIRRAEMLAEVTRLKYCVAIAGTHGKTTTTSMAGLVLMNGDIDPTVIVGGKLSGLGGTNARLGHGSWTVVEADEYDRSFLQLAPTIAVITNLELEHLDIYTDFEDLKRTFIEFANKVPFYGIVAVCLDDPGVMEILPEINKKKITFGLSPQCEVRAVRIRASGFGTRCDVLYDGEKLGEMTLKIPGRHNIRNALGAVAVGLKLGLKFADIQQALADFTGVYRRFEQKGERDGIVLIDDYAHHPTEVSATLSAARAGWEGRIVCIFQPHTYTRTQEFYAEFGKCFSDADVLVVTDIYPARESQIEGVDGKLIADTARRFGHRGVEYLPAKFDVPQWLNDNTRSGDLVLTMGAGDIWKFGELWIRGEQSDQ